MNVIGLIKVLLSLANTLTQYFRDKKLIDIGASAAILKGLRDADNAIKRANAVKPVGSVLDDPENRRKQ